MNTATDMTASLSAGMLSTQILLRGESEENLNWLLHHSRQQDFTAGDVLLTPDKHNDYLYLVLTGRLQVRLDWQGREALTYLDAGHCVGEMSIIENKRPSAIVVTEQDCRLLLVEKDVVWELIERSNTVARNLLYILSSRVRRDNLVIFETRKQQAISEQNSRQDTLTGLYNRRWLEDNLSRLVQRAQQTQNPFCVLMLDIDFFKQYNDSHGHPAGDAALAAIAAKLSDNIRPYDSAIRYGGEEFLVLLPDTAMSDARIIAERLREKISHTSVRQDNGQRLPCVTASIGLAELKARQSVADLIADADAALYRAKHGGRDCVAL